MKTVVANTSEVQTFMGTQRGETDSSIPLMVTYEFAFPIAHVRIDRRFSANEPRSEDFCVAMSLGVGVPGALVPLCPGVFFAGAP